MVCWRTIVNYCLLFYRWRSSRRYQVSGMHLWTLESCTNPRLLQDLHRLPPPAPLHSASGHSHEQCLSSGLLPPSSTSMRFIDVSLEVLMEYGIPIIVRMFVKKYILLPFSRILRYVLFPRIYSDSVPWFYMLFVWRTKRWNLIVKNIFLVPN